MGCIFWGDRFSRPGWSHAGDHKTAKIIRKKYRQNRSRIELTEQLTHNISYGEK